MWWSLYPGRFRVMPAFPHSNSWSRCACDPTESCAIEEELCHVLHRTKRHRINELLTRVMHLSIFPASQSIDGL